MCLRSLATPGQSARQRHHNLIISSTPEDLVPVHMMLAQNKHPDDQVRQRASTCATHHVESYASMLRYHGTGDLSTWNFLFCSSPGFSTCPSTMRCWSLALNNVAFGANLSKELLTLPLSIMIMRSLQPITCFVSVTFPAVYHSVPLKASTQPLSK